MAATDATYFYITDQRSVDRTVPAPALAGNASSSATSTTWRYQVSKQA